MLSLHGLWTLCCEARNIEVDYPVPGDVHSALIAAGIIPHPYKGMNELACRWVADEEWVARRTFELDEQPDGEWCLDIDYLDTVATVLVNGTEVLKAENCFRRYQPDVSNALRKGTNTVEVVLHSNTKAANRKQAEQPFYVPYHAGNCPIPNGNMLRKPQCHFGWDWNLAIVPFGVCGRFELKKPRTTRLRSDFRITQQHNPDGSVDLTAELYWECVEGQTVEISLSLGGVETRYSERSEGGLGYQDVTVHIEKPILWWPAGHGPQHLYELKASCNGHVVTHRIGLCKFELITDKDEAGSRFLFRVNGKDIFCRGANWIPADALPSNITPERCRKLLQAAVDANMNMIRVWGGGYYEKDWFYDLCDELGILVWQDVQFSCNLYPSTEDFLAEVRREVRQQVVRLQHHACIALWCGDNELIGALNWFEESRKNRDRYLVSYDRLNRTVEQAVKSANPQANWWPSSPSPGILDFGDAWHDDSKGDMHFWSVWHEGKDFEHYRDVKPRFCSEFGFQSFPSLRVCKQFIESEDDLNISSAVMEHHQRNKGGNARIAETMFRYFRFPKDFAHFVYLSQIQHGLAMQVAVDYWRSLKPHCMGTLMWQLNDTWPVASWSGLDHDGGWKAMHHMAKTFYAPVSVVAIPDKGGTEIRFWAINDTSADVDVTADVIAVSVEDGSIRELPTLSATVPWDRAIEIGAVKRLEDSVVFWTQNGIRRHITFKPYKHLSLLPPGLSSEISTAGGALSITLSAKALALFVMAECDVAGRYSHNVFDLLPGERRTITFTPDNPADLQRAADTLVIRDLYSSSH